ncbi:unnamed protein product [Camellia sinensis]
MVTKKVGKYEVGRTIGGGSFAKVKFAQNTETRENVAMKVMSKSTILEHRMVDQVLASRTKIYIVLELVNGGDLFDKIQPKLMSASLVKAAKQFDALVAALPLSEGGEEAQLKRIAELQAENDAVVKVYQGRFFENKSRLYFQQLIDAVAHCHSKGVYHRDLKPENLLLDSHGNLKVSDFGLSALLPQGVELLHTACGTPNYLAPEVLSRRGYDGAAADVWSCGVILYVLMAGYLPFYETNLPDLYKKINAAEFLCPVWFSAGAKSLIHKILDPNPETRIRIEGIKNDPWFRKNYVAVEHGGDEDLNLDNVHTVFDDIEEQHVTEQSENNDSGPLIMNAFEMITLSQGLNLSALFDRRQDYVKRQTRFISRQPAKAIISAVEAVAESMGLKVHTRNYKTRLEGMSVNKMGQFAVVLEVFEVAPFLFMVDVRKATGDTNEYHK